jgi:hypothetical protein
MLLVAVDLAGAPRVSAAVEDTTASGAVAEQVSVVGAAEAEASTVAAVGVVDNRTNRSRKSCEHTTELYEFFNDFPDRFRKRRVRVVPRSLKRGLSRNSCEEGIEKAKRIYLCKRGG